jgi:ATP-binding protein involved in chromosome partitioning
MSSTLHERIAGALMAITNPRAGSDVLTSEMVRDVGTTTAGRVHLTMLVSREDDPTLVRDVREALEKVDGVTDVSIEVKDPEAWKKERAESRERGEGQGRNPGSQGGAPASSGGAPPPPAAPRGRTLPVMDTRPATPAVPAQKPRDYPNLGRVIAVSSGKGGVGKSTVATNIAVALTRRGARVGLMDADVYGPNVPRMMGVDAPPSVINQKIIPLEAHGVKVISLGFLIERDQPAIWRGPIVMKIVNQFLADVAWGELDYLIVDMPPGTGDAQLSLVQATHLAGAVIVTTPQEVSVGDALRGVKMFQRVEVPVLGIIENMSWFECPHCGKPSALFGSGGGERLAREMELPLLGQIPLYPRVMEAGDNGMPIVVADPESSAAKALTGIATRLAESLARR